METNQKEIRSSHHGGMVCPDCKKEIHEATVSLSAKDFNTLIDANKRISDWKKETYCSVSEDTPKVYRSIGGRMR